MNELSPYQHFISHRSPRPRFGKSRLTGIQKVGLSYEKKVAQALEEFGKTKGFVVEHGPWFKYILAESQDEPSYCQPDVVLYNSSRAIVVEVKLAATVLALEKLETLYAPVVEACLLIPAWPLVITRSLTAWNKSSGADHGLSFTADLFSTLNSVLPVYLWPGRGKIT